MQPENNPRAAPFVIAVYGLEGQGDALAETLARGQDVRLLLVGHRPQNAGPGAQPAPRSGELAGSGRLAYMGLTIDTRSRTVSHEGRPVELRRREYDLLVHLAQEPARVYTRGELLRDVWGFKAQGTTRTLDTHASRLRNALSRAGAIGWVRVVRAVGYRLAP
jgi:DNA-binding response OmpR family regulator